MLYKHIGAGDRVEITRLEHEGEEKAFISKVENASSKNDIMIQSILAYGEVVRIPMDIDYELLFFTDKGMLRFVARVDAYSEEDGFEMMHVALLSDGEIVQRRGFFRLEHLLPFKFSLINETDHTDESQSITEIDGVIKDISGEGICFVCNKFIEKAKKVECLITLNDDFVLAVTGKVLDAQHIPSVMLQYEYRIMFENILPRDQERIIQFIFKEQRRHLHNVV